MTEYNAVRSNEEEGVESEPLAADGPSSSYSVNSGGARSGPPSVRTSFLRLLGLNSFVAAYATITVSLAMLVLPRECERMFVEDQATGLALLLGIAGISQLVCPVAGYYSDRYSSKYGRRRPFAVLANVVSIAALVGLYCLRRFFAPTQAAADGGRTVVDLQIYRMAYFLAYTLLMVSVNICYAAYAGLVPDLVASSQYGEASGAMALQTTLGSLLGVSLVGFLGVEPYSLYIVVLFVVSVWLWCGVKEEPAEFRQLDEVVSTCEKLRRIAAVYTISVEDEPDFFYVWVSRLSYYTGMSAQAFMQYYLRDVIHRTTDAKQQTALVTMVGMASASIVALPCGSLSDKIGRRKPLVYLSCLIMALTFLGWINATEMYEVLAWSALFGIGNGMYLSIDYALACATMPDHGENAR